MIEAKELEKQATAKSGASPSSAARDEETPDGAQQSPATTTGSWHDTDSAQYIRQMDAVACRAYRENLRAHILILEGTLRELKIQEVQCGIQLMDLNESPFE